MLGKITGTLNVWKNTKGEYSWYSTSIGSKQADDTYLNASLMIDFHKDIVLPKDFAGEAVEFKINNAWLSVAKGKEHNTIKLYVRDAEVVDASLVEPKKATKAKAPTAKKELTTEEVKELMRAKYVELTKGQKLSKEEKFEIQSAVEIGFASMLANATDAVADEDDDLPF